MPAAKATFRRTGHGYVTLIVPDCHPMEFDFAPETEFSVPTNGGYVRMRTGHEAIRRPHGNPRGRKRMRVSYAGDERRQVCAQLRRTGRTLEATPDDLIDVIRREWQERMRLDRKAGVRWWKVRASLSR